MTRALRNNNDAGSSGQKSMNVEIPFSKCVACHEDSCDITDGFVYCSRFKRKNRLTEKDEKGNIPPACPNGLCGNCGKLARKKKIDSITCFCGKGRILTRYRTKSSIHKARIDHHQSNVLDRRTDSTSNWVLRLRQRFFNQRQRSFHQRERFFDERERFFNERIVPATVAFLPLILGVLCATAGEPMVL